MSDATLRDRFDRLWAQADRPFGRDTVFKIVVHQDGEPRTWSSVTYAISPSATLAQVRTSLEAMEGPDPWFSKPGAPRAEVVFSPGDLSPPTRFNLDNVA